MKNQNEPINTKSLLTSIVSLVIGIILCFNSDFVFEVIGYLISAILILMGVIRLITHAKLKQTNMTSSVHFAAAIFFLILGGVIAMFPKFIPTTLSIVIGAMIIFNGISRLVLGLAIRKIDGQGSKVFLLVAGLTILLGIIIITQMFLPLLGAFIIVYSISEIIGYVYYKSQNKDYSEVLNNKTIPRDIKEKEAMDAVIEE